MLGAKPATYYKEGVCGDLNPQMRKCKGRLERLYFSEGLDFFVTAKRDGNHNPGSCHPEGDAIDFKRQGMPMQKIRAVCGPGFDVIDEKSHVHVEWDPHR